MALLVANNISDPDAAESHRAFNLISKHFNFSSQVRESLLSYPALWIPPQQYRRNFCESCILEDVEKGHHPAYRRSWVHRWAVGCPVHLTPLSTIDDSVTNTTDTINLAASKIFSEGALHSDCTPRKILRYRYCGTNLAYFVLALYFQLWLMRNSKGGFTAMPNRQPIETNHLFQLLESLSISIMRPCSNDERLISDAYSHLPPCQWPRETNRDRPGETLPPNDIAQYSPIQKCGFLALVGIHLGIPTCCSLLKVLERRGVYIRPHSRALFPDDERNLRLKVIKRLHEYENPLIYIAENWFKGRAP